MPRKEGNTREEVEARREKIRQFLAANGPSQMPAITKGTKVSPNLVKKMTTDGLLVMQKERPGKGSGRVGLIYRYALPTASNGTEPPTRVVTPSLRERMSQTQKIADASEILFGKGGPSDYSVYLRWVDLTKEMM